jgi:hypothetical protein
MPQSDVATGYRFELFESKEDIDFSLVNDDATLWDPRLRADEYQWSFNIAEGLKCGVRWLDDATLLQMRATSASVLDWRGKAAHQTLTLCHTFLAWFLKPLSKGSRITPLRALASWQTWLWLAFLAFLLVQIFLTVGRQPWIVVIVVLVVAFLFAHHLLGETLLRPVYEFVQDGWDT